MKYRILGRTGLRVSEIGFGAWAIGGTSYGRTDDAESVRALLAAHESGVNFFDTADIYGNGHSEELIGRALAGKREGVILASKVGWDFYHGPTRQNFAPEHIEFACEKSLARLQTDYLDLYQLHNPDLETLRRGGLFEPLERLKRKGWIRHAGVSIHVPAEGVEAIRGGQAETLQLIYNMIDQRAAGEVLPLAQAEGVGIIAREPFACGLLTGKYGKDARFSGPDHRKRWSREKIAGDLDKLERVKPVLASKKVPLTVLGLEFILGHEAVATVIPGAKTAAQVAENLRASAYSCLSGEDIEKVRRIYQNEEIFQAGFFRN